MNCKPGDLAIVIRSNTPNQVNLGKICTIEKWVGRLPGFNGDDWWETSRNFTSRFGVTTNHNRDSNMRPINPPTESQTTDEKETLHA